MKTKHFLAFLTLFISSIFLTNIAQAGDWHTWSQATRNQAIVDETFEDNDEYVGLSCKEWVRDVVLRASSRVVTIPPTASNLYTWKRSSDVVGRSGLIEYAQPGEIVQMYLNSAIEHTAIVLAVSTTGVTFIESNWNSDKVVHTRFVSFSKFRKQVKNYSIYYVK